MEAAPGQTFRLGTWEGALEGVMDYGRQRTKTDGQATSSFDNFRVEERLRLRNVDAFILDPRLATLTFGGTFGLTQEWQKFDGTSDYTDGTLWGYEGFLRLLPEAPYSLNVFANRDQDVNSLIFGGRTETVEQNFGAKLFAKRIYIPSSLTFRQEQTTQETRTGDVVARQDQVRNIVTYEGSRGWENAEATLGYEFTDLTDKILPDLSFRSHDGNLTYSLDFGPELNRRWDSRMRIFSRTGETSLTTGTVDELLRIDHSDRLQTNYRYFLLFNDTASGSTTTQTGDFHLHHQLYESLTTDLRLGAVGALLPGGSKQTYLSRLDFSYLKKLPGDGRLHIGLGGGLQYDDNSFQTQETTVLQETHTFATPFALPIRLANPFVITESVVVTKTAVGPLPAGCAPPSGPPTPLLVGRDFTLLTTASLTEIVPIPCAGATPGINPGDTIAVDYRFAVPRSLAFTTKSFHADVSVDYRWIRPYYIHEQINETLVSGQDGQFLDDERSDTAGMELRYDGGRITASILGEVQRFVSTRVAYDTVRSNQFLRVSILPELSLMLSGDEAWFDYSLPVRKTKILNGRLTLSYVLGGSLTTEAFGGYRHLDDSLVPTERTLEAGLRVRWTFRKLEVDPSLEFFARRLGDTETKDLRAMVHIIRRF